MVFVRLIRSKLLLLLLELLDHGQDLFSRRVDEPKHVRPKLAKWLFLDILGLDFGRVEAYLLQVLFVDDLLVDDLFCRLGAELLLEPVEHPRTRIIYSDIRNFGRTGQL